MTHSGDTPRPRAAGRCCLTIAVLALMLAQQAVEVVAEECGNQEQQFQSSGLPGEFTCHLDDETERRLNEAKQQVSACQTPRSN